MTDKPTEQTDQLFAWACIMTGAATAGAGLVMAFGQWSWWHLLLLVPGLLLLIAGATLLEEMKATSRAWCAIPKDSARDDLKPRDMQGRVVAGPNGENPIYVLCPDDVDIDHNGERLEVRSKTAGVANITGTICPGDEDYPETPKWVKGGVE